MPAEPELASYGALAGDAYRSMLGAAEAVNAETIAYVRSLFGILGKPYASKEFADVAKENLNRSAALVGTTLDTLEANNRHAAQLARDFAGVVTSAHETYVAALRKLADTSVSNVAFAKNVAARQATMTLPLPSVN